MSKFQTKPPRKGEFTYGPWKFSTQNSSILNTEETVQWESELGLPHLPEMTFGNNTLKVENADGFALVFNAFDSLKQVNNNRDLIKVSYAQQWRDSRKGSEYIGETVNPFDWTYTTDYKGTFVDSEKAEIAETTEKINIENLKKKEKILFFDELVLFEDELADNGSAHSTVKIRVMPSCFFILMRFFLRVDGVLFRVHDTRYYHEFGSDYIIREYCEKEKSYKDFYQLSPAVLDNPNQLEKLLDLKVDLLEKIQFPVTPLSTAPNTENSN